MYKIYINKTVILLTDSENSLSNIPPANRLVARYMEHKRWLLNYIDLCEKNSKFDTINIHHSNLGLLKEDFFSLFEIVEAAGGLVFTPEKEILAIYRRKKWDLPKGKIDEGESIEEAAFREVVEETGVQSLVMKSKLHTTFHCYKTKQKKRVLKPTHWYFMEAPHQVLVPQEEEDIEKAVFMPFDDFKQKMADSYSNLLEVATKVNFNALNS